MAIQMNDHDCLGFFCDLLFDFVCVDLEILIRLCEDRSCPIHGNSHDAGNVCICLNDHLISRADAQHFAPNPECVQSTGKSHTVRSSCIFCKSFFKCFYFISQHIPPGAKYRKRLFFKLLLVFLKTVIHTVWHYFHHKTVISFRYISYFVLFLLYFFFISTFLFLFGIFSASYEYLFPLPVCPEFI